jgi:hypothetical protein
MSYATVASPGITVEWFSQDYPIAEETVVLKKTVHNGRPVMRTQDGRLAVILADSDFESYKWSTWGKTEDQRHFLSTDAELVEIVAETYKQRVPYPCGVIFHPRKVDLEELKETIRKRFPECFVPPYIGEGLRLEFVPRGASYRIHQGEWIQFYKPEDFTVA